MKHQTSSFETSNKVIAQIPVSQLDQILEERQFTLIDVRSPEGIDSQGNIPGAFNIPLDTIENALQDPDHEHHSILTEGSPLLFCCTGGVMSYMAAIKVSEYGIMDVHNLEGGHSGWMKYKEQSSMISA